MEELLSRLKTLNINIKLEDGNLLLDIPNDFDAGDIVAEVRVNKEKLITFLSAKQLHSIYAEEIKPAGEQEYYPLSAAQQRIYLLHEIEGPSLAYNMPQVIRMKGILNKQRLSAAFNALIRRHESLRTGFRVVDGDVWQQVLDDVSFSISYTEGTDELVKPFFRPFDLSDTPLFRAGVITTAPHEHLLLIDMHHIITDGVSRDILIKDFMMLYAGKQLPALALQYKDYAVWQQSAAHQAAMLRHRDFWQGVYADLPPVLELPVDFPRPLSGPRGGGNLKFMLDAVQTRALKQQAEAAQCTLFMMLLSYYVILLAKLGNQEDIVTGVPVSGRNHADVEGVAGMFVNTLPLRNYPVSELDYKSFLQSLRSACLSCFDHQDYPYEQLIDDLKIERQAGHHPLFDVMFSFKNFAESVFEIPGLKLEEYHGWYQESKFDLTLSAMEKDGTILLQFEYATTLFNEDSIGRLAAYYQRIADIVINDPAVKLGDISLLSESEREQQLYTWNNTAQAYDTNTTVVSLFDAGNPDAVAVMYKDQELSYGSLKDRSARVAAYLRHHYGLQAGDLVGILSSRNIELMIMIMGILKSGAAYVPIDPSYPAGRRDAIITDSGMKLLITDRPETAVGCQVCSVEELLEASLSEEATDHAPHGADLAYVIYTSGSTGRPKGVMIEHHAVVNRMLWMQKVYQLHPGDVLLQKTPLVFDVSVWELFWWAISGASLCMLEPEGEKDPAVISNTIAKHQVSVIHFVPAMLAVFLSSLNKAGSYEKLKSLRLVFASGEALKPAHVNEFADTLYHHCDTRLINLYGPTEATVDVSFYECSFEKQEEIIPIGKPIDNIQLYVLDRNGKLLPSGVTGELCIGGAGLARGYLNNEELTASKFVSHPFKPGERVYRTGDLARWRMDGELLWIGRVDDQVKLRGYRIEPAEIEVQLHTHEEIAGVVVTARELSGEKCLVAHYTGPQQIDPEELKRYLSQRLPSYMIPSWFVWLPQLPLTVNGKIDRKKLPDPERVSAKPLQRPANSIQKQLIDIWSRVLDIPADKIGVNTNFFEIGGNSLKLVKMVNYVNASFGSQISVAAMFGLPVISRIAELLEAPERSVPAGENVQDIAQLNETLEILGRIHS